MRMSATTQRVLAIFLVSTALYGCGNGSENKQAGAQQPPVSVVLPAQQQVVDKQQFLGRVAAADVVDVRPRVSGYIQEIKFKDGDTVHQGDVLFVIDQRPFLIAQQQAEAELQSAKASFKLAENNWQRVQKLVESQAVSKQTFEQREQEYLSAKGAMQAAEAAVAEAKLNVEFSTVKAPVSGKVGRYQHSVGNLVTAGSDVLTSIVSTNPMYFYFELSEKEYAAVQQAAAYPSMSEDVEAAASENTPAPRAAMAAEVHIDASGDRFAGEVDFLDNQVDTSTGTVEARVVLNNPNNTLVSGMFGRVTLPTSQPYSAFLLPEKLISTDQSRKVVLAVEEGKVVSKAVQLGGVENGMQVIRGGVTASTQVLFANLQQMRPGMPVAATEVVDMSAAQ